MASTINKIPKKGERRENNFESSWPRKGEIWLLSNPERIKEISKDYRPVLVISSNERNEYSNSVVALPLSTDDLEHISLTEVFISNTPENGLDYPSKIQCESPFTWNKGIRFENKNRCC
ncbi:MAG: hypothetical protein GBAus27B_000057 [Mycoplasmataceae bacterium]|nr:MAG: hypothetical protein GBAus27B_000057 [Mycoplasmataceae bacterium]